MSTKDIIYEGFSDLREIDLSQDIATVNSESSQIFADTLDTHARAVMGEEFDSEYVVRIEDLIKEYMGKFPEEGSLQ